MKQNKLHFIGITGGVGAGKSELLQYIKKHYKCKIYLADEVAHEVKKPGTKCHAQLVELLGPDIEAAGGQIDKGKMAEMIFADPGLLERVNAIIHPSVKDYLLAEYERAERNQEVELFFVEAALLIECGYGQLVDEMWYVHAGAEVRRERLKSARGYSEEKIAQIMSSQLTETGFRSASDFIIDNSGDLQDSFKQIDERLEAFTWQE